MRGRYSFDGHWKDLHKIKSSRTGMVIHQLHGQLTKIFPKGNHNGLQKATTSGQPLAQMSWSIMLWSEEYIALLPMQEVLPLLFIACTEFSILIQGQIAAENSQSLLCLEH